LYGTDAEWGCTTEDLNGQASVDYPGWTKPRLGRSAAAAKQQIHLTVTVETVSGVSRLYVYVNGHIASTECDGDARPAVGLVRDYDAPLFIAGDPYFGGFKGEVQSVCLHPDYLDPTTVETLTAREVMAAQKGVRSPFIFNVRDLRLMS
jgi:hypothetical protein